MLSVVFIVVAVSRKYVKLDDLMSTIEELLQTYQKLRVEFPSDVEEHFLVKAWKRKKAKGESFGG